MYRLQVKDHFDAAHFIRDYEGKCQRMHGHRWEVEVVIEGKKLDKLNMLIDFVKVKGAIKEVIERVDHYVLNEVFDEPNVTAEFLVEKLFDCLSIVLNDFGVKVVRTCIWESPDCCVKYYGK